MNERGRKRKSLCEAEDESQRLSWSGKEHYSTYDGGRNQGFSFSKADTSSLMPKDQGGWPSWDTLQENIIEKKGEGIHNDGQDEPGMREQVENKSCYKSMSPGFDRWGRRKRSNSPDDGLSRSRRYVEGGGNRSKDRGRSRSYSPSWSRGRDRSGFRSRSRSRSRNRSRNNASGQTRSRSPFHERRRELQGRNDRSGSGMSSQSCRDFAAGNCRRGSQCRFLHADKKDGDYLEIEIVERWRNRKDREHAVSYGEGPGRQSWDKVFDSSYGEDDSFRSKSRGKICCKDFMRGKCKWGTSCKFSHHVGSIDSKGNRNVPSDRDGDHEHQTSESRKPLCKYFLAGKCHRDNCWFSHDGPMDNNHESRPGDEGGQQSLADKNDCWKGTTWDQVEPESKMAKGSGWNESAVENISPADANPVEKRDNRWPHESRTLRSPEWKEKAFENNDYGATHAWKDNNGGDMDMGAIKSMIVENSIDRQGCLVISRSSDLQNLDVVCAGSRAPNIAQEASSQHLSGGSMHTGISVKSDIQHYPTVVEHDVVNPSSFDSVGELKDDRKTINLVSMPRQSLNQNGVGNLGLNHPLVSHDQRDNLFFRQPSNVGNFDLNGPGLVLSSSLNMQNQTQSHQTEPAKTPEMQELGAPRSLYNDASNSQVALTLLSSAAGSPMQKFVAEQAQAYPQAVLNSLTSTGAMTSLETTMPTQPNAAVRSLDQLDPLGDGRGKLGNGNQTSGEFPYSFEQKNQIPFEQFSPMSGDNLQFENAIPSVSSKVPCYESPESKQQEAPAVSEVKDNNINSGVECQKGQENLRKENGDGHAKVNIKDDKEMRLFKNALVEFVKEILKPKWKEGRMSRDVHKTIVKKAVDKVTSTIQGDHIPKTQDKIDQYLSHSKPKISKLVQAYAERHLKAEA